MTNPGFAEVVKWVSKVQTLSELSEAMLAGKDADLTDRQRMILNSMAEGKAAMLKQSGGST
jgi:hypothetical protein